MKINEIFYSIQGEGFYAGTPAIFVRFAQCNLNCAFCDTDFVRFTEMTEEEIVAEVCRIGNPATHVILTGGEPSLQVTASLCDKLHEAGKVIHIETNGTHAVAEGIDFITCSPKLEYCKHAELCVQRIDELKVVFTGKNDMALYENIQAQHYFLQPCDVGNDAENRRIIAATVGYCKANPKWNISVQIHKVLAIR